MERLAREKIAAQQRLATLRKEVSSLPGYAASAALEGMSTSDAEQMDLEMDLERGEDEHRSLTVANVAAHAQREEDRMRYAAGQAPGRSREADQESNSGTSTASERGDYASDDEAAGPSTFPPESYSHARQPVHVVRPVAQQQVGAAMVNGGRPAAPSPPAVKYVRAAATVPTTSSTVTTLAAQQPTTYLTVVPSTDNGAGGPTQLYQVQQHPHQPSTIAFAGQHHQILAAHHGVQLLTTAGPHGHPSTLKVLTGPTGGAAVRVISADGLSTSLQSLVAVSGNPFLF